MSTPYLPSITREQANKIDAYAQRTGKPIEDIMSELIGIALNNLPPESGLPPRLPAVDFSELPVDD